MSILIAHRGLSKSYPENTLLAFRKAWQAGCSGIELDIQVSQDNQVLVIHDPDTKRIAQKNMCIAQTDWAELQRITIFNNAPEKHYIVTLVDVIATVPTGKTVQIEVKEQINNTDALDAVIRTLNTLRDDIVIQVISFDKEKIIQIQQNCPKVMCFYLLDERHPNVTVGCAVAKEYGMAGIGLKYTKITQSIVQAIHRQGLLLDTWTVNDLSIIEDFIQWGVDFIASDIADECITMLS